ncbi:nicotinate-nucleotide diphosphorylase, partial [Stenotrophomonas sp. HMWF023]
MSALPTPDPAVVAADVARALAEDLGSGDVTAALLPDQSDSAYLLCKQDAVIAGRPWFDATHRALDADVQIEWRVAEGDHVSAGTVLALLHGRSRSLVSAERTSLNFLQTLSGTATTTARYVA